MKKIINCKHCGEEHDIKEKCINKETSTIRVPLYKTPLWRKFKDYIKLILSRKRNFIYPLICLLFYKGQPYWDNGEFVVFSRLSVGHCYSDIKIMFRLEKWIKDDPWIMFPPY